MNELISVLGPLQGEGRRRRLEPGRRESLDVQGVEGDGANAALELRGQQRIKPLTEAVIVQPGEPPRVSTRAPTLYIRRMTLHLF